MIKDSKMPRKERMREDSLRPITRILGGPVVRETRQAEGEIAGSSKQKAALWSRPLWKGPAPPNPNAGRFEGRELWNAANEPRNKGRVLKTRKIRKTSRGASPSID